MILHQVWTQSASVANNGLLLQRWEMPASVFIDGVLQQRWGQLTSIYKIGTVYQRWQQYSSIAKVGKITQHWQQYSSFPNFGHLNQYYGLPFAEAPRGYLQQRYEQRLSVGVDGHLNQYYGMPLVEAPQGYFQQRWVSPEFLEPDPAVTQQVYKLILSYTGFNDLTIPISSIQARISIRQTYVDVVIPNGLDFIDEIADRIDGYLMIYKGAKWSDGREQFNLLMQAKIEAVQSNEGSTNASISLRGRTLDPDFGTQGLAFSENAFVGNTTTGAVRVRRITGVQYESISANQRRVRCAVDTFLRPNDVVSYRDVTWVAGAVTYYISTKSAWMEVTENG